MSPPDLSSDEPRAPGEAPRVGPAPFVATAGSLLSRDQLEDILERITDGFVSLNDVWRYTYVNRKAGELLGRKPEDLIGKHIWTEFPEGVGQKFHQAYYRSLAEQVPIVVEEYYPPWDRWFENRIYPSKNGLSIFFSDVTERKKSEELQARFGALMEGTTDMVGFADPSGRIHHLNPAGRRMLGIPPTGPVPGTLFDYHPQRLRRALREEWIPTALREGVCRGQTVLVRKDGTEFPVSQVLLVHRKPDGSVDFLSTIIRDISDQRRAEDRVQESEARFRTLVENAPEAIVVYDTAARRFVDCNENAVRLFGLGREEILSRGFGEVAAPSAGGSATPEEGKVQEALEGGAPVFEGLYRGAGGREIPCEVRLIRLPGGDRPLLRGSLTDITERKQGLQALKESEARYRTIVENAPEAVVVLDVEAGKFVDFNENALRLFGLSKEECLRAGPVELSPPTQPGGRPSSELALEKVREAVQGRRPAFEWVHRNARGQDFPCEIRLVRIPSERAILVRGSVIDISERKRAEEALRESEERFRQIAETVHDVFWMSTPDLREFLYVSPAFEGIWGRTRKELYRSPEVWTQAMHPDDGGQALRNPPVETGQGRLDITYRIIRPDGAIRWIHERAFPIASASGQVYRRVGIAEDITELKEAEEALRESRKQLEEALHHTQDRVLELEEQVRARSTFGQFIGKSEPMQEVYRRLRLAGQSNVTVLITGESGTGKELAARSIHELGVRKRRPFIAVNCSAIPEALLESELFGHVKGSFTGAVRDKTGLFQSAEGGTLFLDEVGDMPAPLQVKVLRALQEREIRRVGDEKPIQVDVHLVTATNKELESLLASGAMREDFYYRIRVFEIRLPPLRERKDDIPLMVSAFIEELAAAKRKKIRGISAEAMRRLMDYPWPGNVRELRNAIEHAFVTVSGDHLMISDFPPVIREAKLAAPAAPPRGSSGPGGPDRRRIEEALKKTGGNRSEAARLLGVSRVTLWKRMRRHGL